MRRSAMARSASRATACPSPSCSRTMSTGGWWLASRSSRHCSAPTGMAAVYRARDTLLQRDVALKVLYPQYADETTLVERFKREAVLAAGLEHPNIVPVYDVGEQDGMVYIAMKLLDGRSLYDVLGERGALGAGELLPLIDQVASALDYAHARGIVHRDIK